MAKCNALNHSPAFCRALMLVPWRAKLPGFTMRVKKYRRACQVCPTRSKVTPSICWTNSPTLLRHATSTCHLKTSRCWCDAPTICWCISKPCTMTNGTRSQSWSTGIWAISVWCATTAKCSCFPDGITTGFGSSLACWISTSCRGCRRAQVIAPRSPIRRTR